LKYGKEILLYHIENDTDNIQEKLLKSNDYYTKMEVLRIDINQIHAKAGR